jgi:hypothetical protein
VARRSGSLKMALDNVSQLHKLWPDYGRWTNSRTPGVIFDAARSEAMIAGWVDYCWGGTCRSEGG